MGAVAIGSGPTSPDCEAVGAGLLVEPTNALSSLAFLLAGLWIVLRSRRSDGNRVELAIFGLAVASNALGGLLLHGARTEGARWVHDQAIVAVLLFAVVFVVARFGGRPTAWTVSVYAGALVAAGLLIAIAPTSSYAMFALLGVGAGATEAGEYRHELRALRAEGLTSRRAARLGVAALAAVAATAFFVGRTGAALCRPESAFQWHATWHVLAAIAMALYAYAVLERGRGGRAGYGPLRP